MTAVDDRLASALNAVAVGWRAVALWQLGERAAAEELMSALGDAPMPVGSGAVSTCEVGVRRT